MAVSYLKFCGVDLSFIGLNDAVELAGVCFLGIVLLLWNYAVSGKSSVSLEVEFGVAQLSLIARKLTFSLFELDFERFRIDLSERLAFFDELPLLKIDLLQLTIDATPDGHSVERGCRPEGVQIDRELTFGRCGNRNRDGWSWSIARL